MHLDTSHHVRVNGLRLHYLEWGGGGPALLFLAGMGCSAHIFGRFAPRFADRFHVLALDRRGHGDSDYPATGYDPDTLTEDLRQFLDALQIEQVILAGHSMGYIELCHFTALYPERALKLVFLDAAYDNRSPEKKAVWEKNPLPKLIPAWPEQNPDTFEGYAAICKRLYPALAAISGPEMEEQLRHTVTTDASGKVVAKMSDEISGAIRDTMDSYAPEFANIQAPVLSFFAVRDGRHFLSEDYMTAEQQQQVLDFFQLELAPAQRRDVERFRAKVPHARIVEIPDGHHYCFIQQEELVFKEMRQFLLESG